MNDLRKAVFCALVVWLAGTFHVQAWTNCNFLHTQIGNISAKMVKCPLSTNRGQKAQSMRRQAAIIAAEQSSDSITLPVEPKKNDFTKEILAGIVVTLATIPTSISYSTVVGISPIIGIWNSALTGFFAALVGGSPGVIVGSAGVTALPMAALFTAHGPAYMSAALLLASLLETLFGISRLSKYADIISAPVIAGFLNALAIFIFKSQVKVFRAGGQWLGGAALTSSLSLSLATAGLIFGLSHIKNIIKLPPQLVAISFSTLLAQALHLPVKLLSDQAGKNALVGGLKAIPILTGIPKVPLTLDTLRLIGSTSLGVALVCIVETLLAQRISKNSEEVDQDRSMLGLGAGNFFSAIIGGFGGCGLIPNTLLNKSSGGKGNLSSFSYALSMAISVLFFSKVLGAIPMAALAGLMLTVAYNTMEWHESFHLLKASLGSAQHFLDCLAMLITTYLSFAVDMGLGILVGTVVANLLNIYHFLFKKRVTMHTGI